MSRYSGIDLGTFHLKTKLTDEKGTMSTTAGKD